jgi:hypothetical protein
MLEFEDSARSEAPPEEVWKILYDPRGSRSGGKGWRRRVHTPARRLSQMQIPNRLEVQDAGSAVVISCLLHDFVYDWRLEPLDGGQATQISVHVAIPDEKVEPFEEFQRVMVRASVRRLAEVAAESHQVAKPRLL